MRFDVIIGNPPYQKEVGGNTINKTAVPIFHKFVIDSKKLNPRFMSFIVPARWYCAGVGLDDFRADMLSDTRMRTLVDFPNQRDCFPAVDISGGICYFLWDSSYGGECLIQNSINGVLSEPTYRKLNQFDTFIRFPTSADIIQKVIDYGQYEPIVPRKFEFGTNFRGTESDTGIKIYHRNFGYGYIAHHAIKKHTDIIDRYKVFMSESYNTGDGKFPIMVTGRPFVGEPNSISTATYLVMGDFDAELEAVNMAKYLNTKFVRFLIMSNKMTRTCTTTALRYVPHQDFSVEYTDTLLYQKYKLTETEIDFIEKMIKARDIVV